MIEIDALVRDARDRTPFNPSQPFAALTRILYEGVIERALEGSVDRRVPQQLARGKVATVCRCGDRQDERVVPAIVWATIPPFEQRLDPRESIANLDQRSYGCVIGWTVA
jgi:hypothetical protein